MTAEATPPFAPPPDRKRGRLTGRLFGERNAGCPTAERPSPPALAVTPLPVSSVASTKAARNSPSTIQQNILAVFVDTGPIRSLRGSLSTVKAAARISLVKRVRHFVQWSSEADSLPQNGQMIALIANPLVSIQLPGTRCVGRVCQGGSPRSVGILRATSNAKGTRRPANRPGKPDRRGPLSGNPVGQSNVNPRTPLQDGR